MLYLLCTCMLYFFLEYHAYSPQWHQQHMLSQEDFATLIFACNMQHNINKGFINLTNHNVGLQIVFLFLALLLGWLPPLYYLILQHKLS